MNYVMKGLQALKESFFLGIVIYLAVIGLLYLFKKRRKFSWKWIFEALFCVYCVTLIKLTGILTLKYSLEGLSGFNYNLVPFVGSAIVPVLLNFALFLPMGFLLPLVFPGCRGKWGRVTAICGLTSLVIELLQLFGGRYAEVEDLLLNTLGGFSGYVLFTCIDEGKRKPKKAALSAVALCVGLALCFLGIYAVGDNEKQMPDGLDAVENNIAEISVYADGKKRSIGADSYIYRSFASQIYNCGGHLLEVRVPSEDEIRTDTECFIEILYVSPQTVHFQNAENFSLENADRLLYNADRNILYWGNSGWEKCVDYTELDEGLQPYKGDILKSYGELADAIRNYVTQKQ